MEQEIQALDLQRMFLGDLGFAFLLEVAFRTAFMFAYTVLLVRVLGKRGMGQLAPFELVIIIALGSAVGDPMFYPDVPLVHAMLVVAIIVILQRALVRATDSSERIQTFVESQPRLIVREGVIDSEALHDERFARDELFITLREEGIEHLGQVKRAYLEPSGRVSAWVRSLKDSPPGLTVMPGCDDDHPRRQLAGEHIASRALLACAACGRLCQFEMAAVLPECESCGCPDGWVEPTPGGSDEDGDEDGRRPGRRRGLLGQS